MQSFTATGRKRYAPTGLPSPQSVMNLYTQKQDADYKEKTLDLEKQSVENEAKNMLAQQELDKIALQNAVENNQFNQNMAMKGYRQAKDTAKNNMYLAAANLGMDTYGAFADTFGETADKVADVAMPVSYASPTVSAGASESGGSLLSKLIAPSTSSYVGAGIGGLLGATASDWIADKTGMDESTANIVAPAAGAALGYVAPKVAEYATPYVKPAWDYGSGLVGGWWDDAMSWLGF